MAPYVLEIGIYEKASINFRKKFSTMQLGDFEDVRELALCLECSRFLVPDVVDAAASQASVAMWPALIWKMLVNCKLQE